MRMIAGNESTQIAAVVFDLGGVVIDWSPRRLFRKVFDGDEGKVEEFLTRICPLEWNEQQDAGRSLSEATAERIARFPEWQDAIAAYYGRWKEMIGGRVPGTAGIMNELASQGMPLFAASNWSRETFPMVAGEYDELRLFDRIFLSADFGIAKPDGRFYRLVTDRIGLPAEKLLFIDDNARNVTAASQFGMNVHHFVGAGILRNRLRDLGMLASDRA